MESVLLPMNYDIKFALSEISFTAFFFSPVLWISSRRRVRGRLAELTSVLDATFGLSEFGVGVGVSVSLNNYVTSYSPYLISSLWPVFISFFKLCSSCFLLTCSSGYVGICQPHHLSPSLSAALLTAGPDLRRQNRRQKNSKKQTKKKNRTRRGPVRAGG